MTVVSPRNLHPASRQGSSDVGLTAAVTLFAALLVALVARGNIVVGLVVLFLVFVPLERIFALHPRRVFRPGIVTDLTHLLANTTLVTIGTIALVVVAALPAPVAQGVRCRRPLPTELSLALAVVVASIANYWGHRLTHEVPFLWRFHAVHHSIELMDWGRGGTTAPDRLRGTTGITHAIPKLGTRTSVCLSSTSCSGPRTSRRAGDRRRSASKTRSRPRDTSPTSRTRSPAPRSRRRARRYCTRPSSSRSNTSRTRPLSASTVVPSCRAAAAP